jgi:hypothetical protein
MNGVTKHLIQTDVAMLLCARAVHAQTPPKMKMTTPISHSMSQGRGSRRSVDY